MKKTFEMKCNLASWKNLHIIKMQIYLWFFSMNRFILCLYVFYKYYMLMKNWQKWEIASCVSVKKSRTPLLNFKLERVYLYLPVYSTKLLIHKNSCISRYLVLSSVFFWTIKSKSLLDYNWIRLYILIQAVQLSDLI